MGFDNDPNRDDDDVASDQHRRRHHHRDSEKHRSKTRGDVRDEEEPRRSKRKERGDSEDRVDKRSRVRVSDDGGEDKHRSRNRNVEGSGLSDKRVKREEEREDSEDRGDKKSRVRVSDDVAEDDVKTHRSRNRGVEGSYEKEGVSERRMKREEREDGGDKSYRSKNRSVEGMDERDGLGERRNKREEKEEREDVGEKKRYSKNQGSDELDEREGLSERRNKREERGNSEERGDMRSRVYDDVAGKSRGVEGSDERDGLGEKGNRKEESGERGEKRSRGSDDLTDKGKKQRRRFGDKADMNDVGKNEVVNGDGAKATSFASVNGSSRPISATSLSPISSPSTKVSSILTINETKGVNITGSHEVPGKSSTDGTSSVSVMETFSLDALAKARRALQMRVEKKLKNLPPTTKKDTRSEAKLPVGSKEGSKGPSAAPVSGSALCSGAPQPELKAPDLEAVKRAQEVAMKLGFRQDPQFAPIINMFPGQIPAEVIIQPKPSKTPVLRLDAQGREIDEDGNVVNTSKVSNLSTLKVNINKQKKEAFQILKPELDVDPEKNPHFDPRMGIDSKKLLRPKKSTFQFVDEGKWTRDAEIIKLKSQFGEAKDKELRVKQAQLAKAKAEPEINPNLIEVAERVIIKEKPKDVIPKVEWWDQPLLQSGTYDDIADGTISEDQMKMEKITIYVEHPRPIEPPAEAAPPPPQPLKLTKKEQKKLRTQRRLAREKDRQEMIRQGIIEPPKAKVKMSNLMRVLGSEATQDPTKLEMEIRSAAAEREQAHVDRNIARKLTPDERREKRERKLFGDPSVETIVSVYKINDLSPKKLRFKVDINAQENRLTGCAVISDDISIVVVEGGNKSIKRYGKLMLKRIDWEKSEEIKDEMEDDVEKPLNKCVLVWQGSVAKSSFHRFFVHECRTEAAARKVLIDAGVGHYWDLAVNFTEDV